MPDAIIVADEKGVKNDTLSKMVRVGLVNMAKVNGVRVYGRHYLTQRAIREAYKKQKER